MASPDLISELVKPLERDLRLREGFFVHLQNEDDWSFIIKGHAFLEAVFSHVLSKAIANDDLKEIFTELEFSNHKTGKVAFANALGLLSPEDRRFLRTFSELRNRVVHDVTQTRFDLSEYIASLDHNQRRSFAEAFSLSPADSELAAIPAQERPSSYVLHSPKEAIWVAIMALSSKMYFGPKFPIFFLFLVLLQGWLGSISKDGSTEL